MSQNYCAGARETARRKKLIDAGKLVPFKPKGLKTWKTLDARIKRTRTKKTVADETVPATEVAAKKPRKRVTRSMGGGGN